MSQIGEWLHRVIASVILAGFIELLLPNNELKNATRMIIGLVIIMILIQPLVKFINLPQNVMGNLPSITDNQATPSTGQILKQGIKLRQDWNHQFSKTQRVILEQKIRNMIGLIDGVQLQNLLIQIHNDDLAKIILKVKPSNGQLLDVDSKKQLNSKIKNSVQLITNLTQKQIEVIWSG